MVRACRNRQAVPSQVEPPAPTDTGTPSDSAPAKQSSRTQVRTKTGTLQDEEQFDIDDVSGSEDDYDPPQSDHGNDSDANSSDVRYYTGGYHPG
jgi:hypothetical protein